MSGTNNRRQEWKYTFKKVECDNSSGDPRLAKVTCKAQYTTLGKSQRTWQVPDASFPDHCDVGTKCMSVFLPTLMAGGPKEEVVCVDEKDFTEETVTSKQKKAKLNHEDVHCGLSLQLPGSSSQSTAHQRPLDVVLTEEVRQMDGTPYKASELYIVDTTDPQRTVSRAYRTEADVASALVEIPVYRGRLQQRTYEFCMKMAPEHVASSVIFAYSFLQVPQYYGRVPLQIDEKHQDVSD